MGLQQTLKALADPIRRDILKMLKNGRMSAGEITSHFNVTAASISRHLSVLKEAGVVDSGGAGLFYIMDGFNRVLNGEEISQEEAAMPKATAKPLADYSAFGPDSVMTFGYCTEMLLQLQNSKVDVDAFDVEALKEFLGSIGDSVVAFKTESIVKLHVHTFTPEKVLAHCRTFGEFLTVKIENMTLQHTESDKEVSFVMKAEAPAEEEPAVERKQYGVVAVSNGDGISSLLKELGTDEVVPGGQTQNPSTNDFLDAFSRVHAEHIFVFPNNGNIVMAARQAASLHEDATVHVIPSKNIGTGYVGISSIDFENPDPQAVIAQVEAAMQRVTAGYVSPSIRDADMNGVHIQKGDTIGIIEKEIVVSEADMMTAATKLAVQLLDGPDKFMLTVFSGKDATENDRAALSAHLSDACPSAEVYFIDGGQDIYPFIFVAE